MLQAHNKHADALATLAYKIDISGEVVDLGIIKKTLQATLAYLSPLDTIMNDIGTHLLFKTDSVIFNCGREGVEGLHSVKGQHYFRDCGGVLARSIYKANAKEELYHVNDLSCCENDISPYRRL